MTGARLIASEVYQLPHTHLHCSMDDQLTHIEHKVRCERATDMLKVWSAFTC